MERFRSGCAETFWRLQMFHQWVGLATRRLRRVSVDVVKLLVTVTNAACVGSGAFWSEVCGRTRHVGSTAGEELTWPKIQVSVAAAVERPLEG